MHSTELTSVTLPGWRDLYLATRANLEWFAAMIAGVHVWLWRAQVTEKFVLEMWDLGGFYSAMFDWSSIQAALLFGVYAFFLSRSEAFLQAVASSQFFPRLRQYVLRSLYLSLALTVMSLPLLIAPPSIKSSLGYTAFSAVFCLFIFTFFCFLKVIRVFGKIDGR